MTAEDLKRVKKAVIRKYPITCGIALGGLDIELTTNIPTAAVVGVENKDGVIEVSKMVINPEFFDKLTFSERVFVLAHEALHIAFKHFRRAITKPTKDAEKKYEEYCQQEQDETKRKLMKIKLHNKYQRIWNIATDACINALLRKDGLPFPEVIDPDTGEKMQFVDIKDGLHKSAEKIYDYLVAKEDEKEKKESQNSNNNDNSQGDINNHSSSNNGDSTNSESSDNKDCEEKSSSTETSQNENGQSDKAEDMADLDNIDIESYKGFDSHDSWTGEDSKKVEDKTSESKHLEEEIDEEIDEETLLEKESEKKNETTIPSLTESLKKLRLKANIKSDQEITPIISWKRLLVGILEKTEEVWGTRRASRFNPNARIEERTFEKLPQVEVLLDTSGSISTTLLKNFLLQLCPLFAELNNEASIKIGCFSTQFSGFKEIKTKQDILDFNPYIGGGTDFELAATSFSPDPGRQITKIVFTDGWLGTPQQTRNDSIIWIVFGNDMNFKPIGGRVIKISEEECKKLVNFYDIEEPTKKFTK